MLTIPEAIKEKLHQDTCHKNIRIHFPNGERSDICNDLIVKDSVSFTESLVSQDTLKFGLCESPVFECETVGVGNIKGATIEVTCEIYHINDDGAVFRPDLQKYVYPIPYGTFIVESCKRQADLNHRKIIAYNVLAFHDFSFTEYQEFRSKYPSSTSKPFSQKLIPFITENIQSNAFLCTETEVSGYVIFKMEEYGVTQVYSYKKNMPYPGRPGGIDYYEGNTYKLFRITAANADKVYKIVLDNYDPAEHEGQPQPTIFAAYMKYFDSQVLSGDWGGLLPVIDVGVNYPPTMTRKIDYTSEDFTYIYPYMSLNVADENQYYTPSEINDQGFYIGVLVGSARWFPDAQYIETLYIDPNDVHIYELTPPDDYAYIFNRVLYPDGGFYYVGNPESINMRDIFSGYLETLGLFGMLDRFNVFKLINIKRQFGLTPDAALYPGETVYPQGVTGGKLLPEDYQSCWYDDEYTKPFGAIVCEYKNALNEDNIYTFYLNGFDEDTPTDTYQTYDLSNNNIIKSDVWTQQQIEAICNTIAQNIEGVQYMPVEFVGRGLPYVEAGDTFEILTKSNDSITTIVLRRTLTGEQVLTDSYKSV